MQRPDQQQEPEHRSEAELTTLLELAPVTVEMDPRPLNPPSRTHVRSIPVKPPRKRQRCRSRERFSAGTVLPSQLHKPSVDELWREGAMPGIEELIERIANEAKNEGLEFLVVGPSGVGKSKTLNTFMGKEVARVGDHEPTTLEVNRYLTTLNGVPTTVIDTPGLCDALPEMGRDEEYLDALRAEVRSFHCLWFVVRLDVHRVTADEQRAIKLLTLALGNECWERAVLVFTHAGNTRSKYVETLAARTRLYRDVIAEYTGAEIALRIPACAVENEHSSTPDGALWLPELYTTTLEQVAANGATALLIATARPDPGSSDAEPIPLSREQQARVNEQIRQKVAFGPELLQAMQRLGRGVSELISVASDATRYGIERVTETLRRWWSGN